MYNVENGSMNLINRAMKYAVLTKIWSNMLTMEIDGELTCMSESDFYYAYGYLPETVRLIAEENKRTFLYSVADSNEKPKGWTPESYFNLIVDTFAFLCDEDLVIPNGKHDQDKIDARFPGKGYRIEHFEYVISASLESMYEISEYEYNFNRLNNQVFTEKTFAKAFREAADLFRTESESKETYSKMVDKELEEELQSANEFSDFDKNNVFKCLFESTFAFPKIVNNAFCDKDYLYLKND